MEQSKHYVYKQINIFVYGFFRGVKKPAGSGRLGTEFSLGVHGPPEDVAEDADLLILHLLERVVLVRVIFSVKAA